MMRERHTHLDNVLGVVVARDLAGGLGVPVHEGSLDVHVVHLKHLALDSITR